MAVEGIGPPEVVAALCDLSEAGADPELFDKDPFGERAARATVDRLRSVVDRFNSVAGDRLEEIKGSVSVVTRDGVALLSAWIDTLESTATFDEMAAFVTGLDDRNHATQAADLGNVDETRVVEVVESAKAPNPNRVFTVFVDHHDMVVTEPVFGGVVYKAVALSTSDAAATCVSLEPISPNW